MDPLIFTPLLKRLVWGGRRLGELLGKRLGDHDDYAESWEIVDHGDDQSVVASGPLAGKSLRQLLDEFPRELLGRDAALAAEGFPLLLKYLDCHRVLSVQVHPDDEYASRMPVPDKGKTEAWYVLDAGPDSRIYAGLRPGVDAEQLATAVAEGSCQELLHAITPRVGECYFIPAGTVHALGEGLVVAEIQQSSDTTFRLFDWNRVDAQGRSRDLHVAEALAVTDFARGPVTAQTPVDDTDGLQTLVRCHAFELRAAHWGASGESAASGHTLPIGTPVRLGGDNRMRLITVVCGRVTIRQSEASKDDHPSITLGIGDSAILPAATGPISAESESGPTTLLVAQLP